MYPYNSRYKPVLQYNPVTDEPFITLPAPHSNIRLTPPRMSDADDILPIMNDLTVSINFASPPYPYLREHCDAWLEKVVDQYEKAVETIKKTGEEVGYIDIFPLRHIREVAPDGTETFLGDMGLAREFAWNEIRDPEAKAARFNANSNLPPGDPEIIWTIGDYLRPSHHGRGIMTVAIKTMIEAWAVPHMNARKFRASTFPDNIGSQKTFLKNGFVFTSRVNGVVQFPESKGGHLMDTINYERNIPVDDTAI
ncbi:GNAT family acetyltransferase [Ceratobasidium sp. AG-Ba]|nr:GNAT family acetyltransferase [Ceratobasidium sp. AG-Ba]